MSDLERKVDLLVALAVRNGDARNDALIKELLSLCASDGEKPVFSAEDRESFIASILNDLGIPCNLRGHAYLTTAIAIVASKPKLEHIKVCDLYRDVADQYGTKPNRVERCIRTAIGRCVEVSCDEVLRRYFYNIVSPKALHPLNGEFIYQIADYVLRNESK